MFTRMSAPSPIPKSVAPVALARTPRDSEAKTEFVDLAPRTLPGGTLPEVKALPPPDFSLSALPRAESLLAISAMRSSMKKEMKVVFGASYQVAAQSTGTSIINELVPNDLMTGLAEFESMATLFSEFFVNEFEVVYQPVSRYTKGGITSQSTYSDLPLAIVDLQHGRAAYATHTQACAAGNMIVANTADPWKMKWRNTESKKAGSLPNPSTGTPLPTQGWCLTGGENAPLYTGSVQIISPAAFADGTTPGQLFGTVVVKWSVSFRSRN